MKKILFSALVFCLNLELSSQNVQAVSTPTETKVLIDLNTYSTNTLEVQVEFPKNNLEKVHYFMPKVIPGTYSSNNYGRLIESITALDQNGKLLSVNRIDENKWEINDAKNLKFLKYRVKDSFDDLADKEIFRPSGSQFETDYFVLNLFALVGYIEEYKNQPYQLEIRKPQNLYGSTVLTRTKSNTESDVFKANSYFELHDSPIMYAKADTASAMVFNCKVKVAVHSQTGTLNAQSVLKESRDVLDAIGVYLGRKLPVNEYVILLLAEELKEDIKGYGALEHNKSTFIYMPEYDAEELLVEVRNIVAHEFLHIVTPLNFHCENVHKFNFYNPKMSSHLWLYEGITEYTSMLVQVRAGLISPEAFMKDMEEKMDNSDSFNSFLPMTVMSRNVISLFNDQYLNVYQKGAISGLALDLKLRILSKGQSGLGDLINKLSSVYGPDTFFVDNELFDIMVNHSYPELKEFFARHYEGAEPFPLEELLAEVGILYRESIMSSIIDFGDIGADFDETQQRLFITTMDAPSPLSQALGLKAGDRLESLNKVPLRMETSREVFKNFFDNIEEGEKVEMEVLRFDNKGKWTKIKLKAIAQSRPREVRNYIQWDENLTTEQSALRSAWLNLN